jgi:hypothetical protein
MPLVELLKDLGAYAHRYGIISRAVFNSGGLKIYSDTGFGLNVSSAMVGSLALPSPANSQCLFM